MSGWGGENLTVSVRVQMNFFGAEVAKSYKQAFGREGKVLRKRYNNWLSDWVFFPFGN